jgi:hypothetical protein
MTLEIELGADEIKQAIREYLDKRGYTVPNFIHLHPYIADPKDPRETSGCTATTKIEKVEA